MKIHTRAGTVKVIERAPLTRDERLGNFDTPHTPHIPQKVFWIFLAIAGWILVAFLLFQSIEYLIDKQFKMSVAPRLDRIENDHRSINRLLWREAVSDEEQIELDAWARDRGGQ